MRCLGSAAQFCCSTIRIVAAFAAITRLTSQLISTTVLRKRWAVRPVNAASFNHFQHRAGFACSVGGEGALGLTADGCLFHFGTSDGADDISHRRNALDDGVL